MPRENGELGYKTEGVAHSVVTEMPPPAPRSVFDTPRAPSLLPPHVLLLLSSEKHSLLLELVGHP